MPLLVGGTVLEDKSNTEFLFVMLEMAKHECVQEFQDTGNVEARLILGEDPPELDDLIEKEDFLKGNNNDIRTMYKTNGVSYIFYGYGQGDNEEFLSIVCFDGSTEYIWINEVERHGDEIILCGWKMLDET